eukprot:4417966-Prymnesium_polylepis.2
MHGVLTASTVMYDQVEHCPIRLRAWTDNQAIGGGPRGCTRLWCKVPATTTAAAVVVRPSRRRVLKALQALPLQALHLAYEAGPSATYDVPAWASGRPSRVGVSSAAGLIITATDARR